MEPNKVSKKLLKRLPVYLNHLKSLPEHSEHVSATAIAKALGLGDVQVRKDLAKVSHAGRRRTGRSREQLIQDIEDYLDFATETGTILVDAGKLGQALLDYSGFEESGLNVMAGFDIQPTAKHSEAGIGHQVLADLGRTFLLHNMGDVFITEMLHGRHHGIGRGLAQSTEGTGLNEVADFLQLIQVFQGTLALGNLGKDLQHTSGADPAGRALAAGFVADKLHVELDNVYHAVVLVHDDGAAGAHHGSLSNQIVKVDGFVQGFGRQAAAGRTTGLDGLELLAIGNTAEEVFAEMAAVTPSYGGMSYERLEALGSLQWPCPTADHPGTPILHVGKFSRGERALFKPAPYRPSAETPDAEYPMIFTTGRILYHYHTSTMTDRVEGLMNLSGHAYVELNPADAAKLGVVSGNKVKVTSRRGHLVVEARVTDIVAEGVLFMPFHFADGPANVLTNTVIDPTAKIPELKVCAARIEKV